MGLRINSNVASISAQGNLRKVTDALLKNFERLSTGRRINRASDDPAGLAISQRLRAQISGLTQAGRNAADGISLVQTADGSLGDVADALQRARELAVESATGTLTGGDKDALQAEFKKLVDQIDTIAKGAEFNRIQLLDGTRSNVTIQIGANTTAGVDTLDVTLSSATASSLGLTSLDVGSTGNTTTALTAIDAALDTIATARAKLGAAQNTLNAAVSSTENRVQNLSSAISRILDVDIAAETAELTKNSILQQAALAILAQANQQPAAALSLLKS